MEPNVFVVQFGKRRRYIVPQAVHEIGRLKYLCTDLSSRSFLFRMLRLSKYSNSRNVGLPDSKVVSFSIPFLFQKIFPHNVFFQNILWRYSLSVFLIVRFLGYDFKGVYVYFMYCENYLFAKFVKWKGGKVITDVFIKPSIEDCHGYDVVKSIDILPLKYIRKSLSISDYILVPSESVRQGVQDLFSSRLVNVVKLPYGNSLQTGDIKSRGFYERQDQVVWVGGSAHRKGLDRFLGVAECFQKEGKDTQFLIVGLDRLPDSIGEISENVRVVGKVDSNEVADFFLTSRCFLFPTRCEGLAGVALEAISFGCPVVTTLESGVDGLQDGENGMLISKTDSDCVVADKVRLLVEDEIIFTKISRSANEMLEYYSGRQYKERIKMFVNGLSY